MPQLFRIIYHYKSLVVPREIEPFSVEFPASIENLFHSCQQNLRETDAIH